MSKASYRLNTIVEWYMGLLELKLLTVMPTFNDEKSMISERSTLRKNSIPSEITWKT